jgi:transcriptional regulator with XRE-family HTH domain
MNIGIKLKTLREKRGLNQKQVAEGVGISTPMISMYETSSKKPSRDTIVKLANFFDVDASYLMDDDIKTLNAKDKKDVAKTLDKIMGELADEENSPLFYGGEMSETDKDLLRNALQNALEVIKIKNKEKYTPNKYKNSIWKD